MIEGKYKFPTGSEKLANAKMDHFDFRKDEQGKYIVDFFYKKGPTAINAEREQQNQMSRVLKRLAAEKEALLKREAERKASREKRMLEAKNALCFFVIYRLIVPTPFFLKYRADHPLV